MPGGSKRITVTGILFTLLVFIISFVRRNDTEDISTVSASSSHTVVPLQEDALADAAHVLAAAFVTEAFTTTAFGDSMSRFEDEYSRVVELLLRAHFQAGQPIYCATTDGGVTGVALISRPGVSWTPIRLAWLFTRQLPLLIRLFTRIDWTGVYHIIQTIRPPKQLPSAHYRLEAIGVAPAAQGQGVGRALLGATHAFVAHDPGASGTYLLTGQESLQRLYERFGYQNVETKESNGVVAYHMFRPNE